jgi:hypothetical protein
VGAIHALEYPLIYFAKALAYNVNFIHL